MNRAVSLLFCLTVWVPCCAEDEFINLFNGKDLSGWKGDSTLWTVEDGAITGTTMGPDHLPYNKFLIWDGGTVKDFELRLQFRLEGDNNSGVQYRSQHLADKGEWVVGGYQADLHVNPPYVGMLYDERGRGILAQRGQKVVVQRDGSKVVEKLDLLVDPLKLDDWHEVTILARGNHLIHKIDGVTVVEVVDEQEAERELEGILALQVHRGPAMKVQFKDIRLKNLSKDEPTATGQAGSKRRRDRRPRPEDIHPEWIWLTDGNRPLPKVYFRKEIQLAESVSSARLYATCDQAMTIYIDGQQILQHARWERPVFKEVRSFFQEETPGARHVIAVEAENDGQSPAGLLLKIVFDSGWRDARTLVTDGSWQASARPRKGWKTAGFQRDVWPTAAVVGKLGEGPWKEVTAKTLEAAAPLRAPTATPSESLRVAKGFTVELLYSVPKEEHGSWVNMCVDQKGRLIVSDQYGGLYRVTPPPIGASNESVRIEEINVDIGEAQGLLWAFDGLYVVVNRGEKYETGLYRVRDADGDDKLDTLETLRTLNGRGEHGPHAVLLAPDGKSLFVVCGNGTRLTEYDRSHVPPVWDEDVLLPRVFGRGFMRETPAPGGYIARTDPEGTYWELVAVGFRNPFDAAVNADGELFTFDADMEWDMNTPWYRPTRVCHVVSGADFGWRNGSAKWPVYYPDSLPPVIDVGPGSPTGVCFGYGARFPAEYQRALFICDWSYGKLYAVHLEPRGASYGATLEEFLTGAPLPLTDVVVNPQDGAMYFAIGGRRVQSGLYRVTYVGPDSVQPIDRRQADQADVRALRRRLESLHSVESSAAIEFIWPHLGHPDRLIRYAARIALEHQPVEQWQRRALAERDMQTGLTTMLALVRMIERADKGRGDPLDTPPPVYPAETVRRHALQPHVLAALDRHDCSAMTVQQQIELLRVYTIALLRLGPPDEAARAKLIAKFDAVFPSRASALNSELAQLLVYLQAPSAAAKIVALLQSAPTQEEQIDYAKTLRNLREGWTAELRQTFLQWFIKAAGYRGGASFSLFVQQIKADAVAKLTPTEKEALSSVLNAQSTGLSTPIATAPRPFVKQWQLDELSQLVESSLNRRDFDHGREMFAAANCFACHRFDNQGGAIGPDLTALSGRFSTRDILEAIVEPSKVISDQYAAVQILTMDGRVITGRIVNHAGDSFRINTNMLDPNAQVGVNRKQIEAMFPSKTSMMPTGLLDTLNETDVLDLMAYLLSRGDRNHPVFQGGGKH